MRSVRLGFIEHRDERMSSLAKSPFHSKCSGQTVAECSVSGPYSQIPHRILNTCFGFDGDEHCVCAHGFFVAELPGFESGSPVKSRLCMTRICHSPAFFAITKFNNP